MRVGVGVAASASGGLNAYPSGQPFWFTLPNNLAGFRSKANEDILVPFIPPADVSIDSVDWIRNSTSAANVYVGIYDAAGTLLTDCAVDSVTTAGLHQVDTTNADLTGGNLYYWCLNQSSSVAVIDNYSAGDIEVEAAIHRFSRGEQVNLAMLSSLPSEARSLAYFVSKARTNAALLSSLTLTGWTASASDIIAAGVTPA